MEDPNLDLKVLDRYCSGFYDGLLGPHMHQETPALHQAQEKRRLVLKTVLLGRNHVNTYSCPADFYGFMLTPD